jgi:hypothetical protein
MTSMPAHLDGQAAVGLDAHDRRPVGAARVRRTSSTELITSHYRDRTAPIHPDDVSAVIVESLLEERRCPADD